MAVIPSTKAVSGLDLVPALESDDRVLIGNPFSGDTFKAIEGRRILPKNIVYVSQESDFGTPSAGQITLTSDNYYIISKPVFHVNELVVPPFGNVFFQGTGHRTSGLVYSGTGVQFVSDDLQNLFIGNMTLASQLGDMFDILSVTAPQASCVFLSNVLMTTATKLGTITNCSYISSFAFVQFFDRGIVLNSNFNVILHNSSFSGGKDTVGSVLVTFRGNIPKIECSNNFFSVKANETVFDIEQTSTTLSATAVGNTFVEDPISPGGAIFTSTGKDKTDEFWKWRSNFGLSDSTVSSEALIVANTANTTITATNTPTQINNTTGAAIWSTNALVEERMFFQDVCTFNNITNTITVGFDHNLTNGDRIRFRTITGTLPVGIIDPTNYFAIGVTAATSQVSLTPGGPAVNFTSDGIGTNFYLHQSGVSESGIIIYTGLDEIILDISGWVSIQMVSGAVIRIIRANVMKVSTALGVSLGVEGSRISISSTTQHASILAGKITLNTNEGVTVYVENTTNTFNMVVLDAIMTYTVIA